MGFQTHHRTDRRTLKTQRHLRTAFLDLLAEKPLDKITVAELTRASDIGRGTFYLHYRDVYDLYDSLVTETIEHLNDIFTELYPPEPSGSFEPMAKKFITYVVDNRRLFDILTRQGKDIEVLKRIVTLLTNRVLQIENLDQNVPAYAFIVNFAAYGFLGVLTDWLENGQQVELDDLIQIIQLNVHAIREKAFSGDFSNFA